MTTQRIWDFHGGIHPDEKKSLSTRRPIAQAPIPQHLILPLNQHIGQPAHPVIQVGDRVLKGQQIAQPSGTVSTAVHAPSSGEVMAIEERRIPHPSGLSATCIVIATDGLDEWADKHPLADYTQEDPSQLVQHIQQAGIAGLGGAGFPSAVKLKAHQSQTIDTLIINAAECEPYITADDMLMREKAAEIISGIQILLHILKPKACLIGIEDNKPQAIQALKTAVLNADNHLSSGSSDQCSIQVVDIPTKYPSGGEKQLIEILTGQQVPSGGIPADIGILCHNVGTAVAIHDAVINGEPLIKRITTVTGEGVAQAQNWEVLLGTPMRDLLDWSNSSPKASKEASLKRDAKGMPANTSRLIVGGPMMGFTVPSADIPVIKTTNCLLVPTQDELPAPGPEQACIRCGLCAEVCPALLLPQQLYWFAKSKEFDKAQAHHLMDCIECGACAYVCPSQIPLVQYYRHSKGEIRREAAEKIKSDRAKDRFEARQARLEAEEAEKIARRKARASAAAKAKASAAKASVAPKGESQQQADSQAVNPAINNEVSAVDAAIARIQAKKKAKGQTSTSGITDDMSLDELNAQLQAAHKRLQKAQQRLADAEAQGLSTVEAFRAGVEKQRNKVQAIEAAIKKQQSNSSTT